MNEQTDEFQECEGCGDFLHIDDLRNTQVGFDIKCLCEVCRIAEERNLEIYKHDRGL